MHRRREYIISSVWLYFFNCGTWPGGWERRYFDDETRRPSLVKVIENVTKVSDEELRECPFKDVTV